MVGFGLVIWITWRHDRDKSHTGATRQASVKVDRIKHEKLQGLPWWLLVKDESANAGDMRLIPDPRRLHMLQLSLSSSTTEPLLLRPAMAITEARMPESSCSPTRKASTTRE